MTLPPLPAIGSIRVEIFGALPGSAKWDEAVWDESTWAIFDWIDITPQSVVAKVTWGADDPIGVFTHPASGSWIINTYDPLRLLDPSNGNSQYAGAIRPGKALRLSYIHSTLGRQIVRQGIIDEVDYDLTAQTGTLRGTDMVQLLVGATINDISGVPSTLRARAQFIVNRAQLQKLIKVETTPAGETDPPTGPVLAVGQSAWEHILSGALDALYAVWMDRSGMLRFRAFGDPRDNGFQVGGVDGIPLSTMQAQGSLQGVYTQVTAFDTTAPTVAVSATDDEKRAFYGIIPYKRDSPVPNALGWVNSVLADRSGAALQYALGTLYPQTEDALESILALGMIDIAHLVAEQVAPPLDVNARVLGGTIVGDTGTGWTANVLTYVPATEWEQAETPEPPVIIPPEPPVTTQVVRTYNCRADSRLVKGSVNGGNGTDTTIAIGAVGSTRNRAVLDFDTVPWSGVVEIVKAELLVTIGSESCGAFGSAPKVVVSRITQSWSEGTFGGSCAYGSANSVVYPGPSVTSSGQVTSTVPQNSGTDKSIDVTAIARAWLGGQSQRGLRIISAGEDAGKYTTSIYTRHHGTSGNRPQLKLTLKVKV